MILKVFTNGDGPIEREALEIGARLESEKATVEYIDLNSEESTLQSQLYDIYSSPSLVVTQDDGKFVECWRGEVPIESEIKNFMRL